MEITPDQIEAILAENSELREALKLALAQLNELTEGSKEPEAEGEGTPEAMGALDPPDDQKNEQKEETLEQKIAAYHALGHAERRLADERDRVAHLAELRAQHSAAGAKSVGNFEHYMKNVRDGLKLKKPWER